MSEGDCLDLAYQEAKRDGRLQNLGQLREAIVQGAAKRLRPKFMTFCDHLHWPASGHVGDWHGFRCNETDRRAYGVTVMKNRAALPELFRQAQRSGSGLA
jgi:hypothetical protein